MRPVKALTDITRQAGKTSLEQEPTGLEYVEPDALTIRRRRAGRRWHYRHGDGTPVADPDEIMRLDAAMAGGEAGKAAGRNIEPACGVLHSGTSPHDGEPR